MPDRRHHLTDRVMKTKDDACHRLWPQSRRQVWWPSLLHTLWPPLPPPRGVSLLSVALLICSLAPFLSAEPVITSPSLPFPCENCQNASMSNVTQNYPSLANLIGPLFSFPLNNTSQFVHKSFNRLWRPKRSILFGRKRTQNGHPSGRSLAGNHTGPPPHYLEQTAANPNYWIPDRYHENAVCLLASFSGIVRIRPSNSSFRGGTFRVSPEDSLGRRSNCERSSRNMFWKFSQYDEKEVVNEEEDDYDINLDDETPPPKKADLPAVVGSSSRSKSSSKSSRMVQVERSNRLLSAGFHVVGSVIEFHVAYIECLQQADKNVLTNRYRVYSDGVCVNLSVSFDLGSFGDRFAYECNYIWGKTLKDVHYTQNRRFYSGEVQISLKMVRIEKDPVGNPFAFRKTRRRCAWDSLLSWQSMTIVFSLIVIVILVFFCLCVCSNSSCSDDAHETNWFSCFCCSCWRRRRRPIPMRPLMERNPMASRQNHIVHDTSNHRNNHLPRPPPPPPPPSSMNSSRNQTSNSRKPTFSTASYSYEGSGNGNGTTGQSSSAMSTALETDSNESNGHSPGGQRASLFIGHYLFSHTSTLTHRGHWRRQIQLRLISRQTRQNELCLQLASQLSSVSLRCHLLFSLPQTPLRQAINSQVETRSSNTFPCQSFTWEAISWPVSPLPSKGPLGLYQSQLLFLYCMYWQLANLCQQQRLMQRFPSSLPRDDSQKMGAILAITAAPTPKAHTYTYLPRPLPVTPSN